MVKRSIVIALIAVFIMAATAYWFLQRQSAEHEAFFGTPQKYDMTNGQEMRPRW